MKAQEVTMGALSEAESTGDRLEILRALRGFLATSIEEAEPDKRGPLAARLLDVLSQIEALTPAESKGTPLDELKAKRAARGGSADADAPRSTRERAAARRRR